MDQAAEAEIEYHLFERTNLTRLKQRTYVHIEWNWCAFILQCNVSFEREKTYPFCKNNEKLALTSKIEDRNSISSWQRISSQLEDRNSKYFYVEFRAGFEYRASSKIEIQSFSKSNFELDLNFEPARWSRISSWIWISSQLEDRNSKCFQVEFRAGFEFRASSKIEIQTFSKSNLERNRKRQNSRKWKIKK